METVIFTCKYFKFGSNTTGLSQSHFRNFLACSIYVGILYTPSIATFNEISEYLNSCARFRLVY